MTHPAQRNGRDLPPLRRIVIEHAATLSATSTTSDRVVIVPLDSLDCGHLAVNQNKGGQTYVRRRCVVCGGASGRVRFHWRGENWKAPIGAFGGGDSGDGG